MPCVFFLRLRCRVLGFLLLRLWSLLGWFFIRFLLPFLFLLVALVVLMPAFALSVRPLGCSALRLSGLVAFLSFCVLWLSFSQSGRQGFFWLFQVRPVRRLSFLGVLPPGVFAVAGLALGRLSPLLSVSGFGLSSFFPRVFLARLGCVFVPLVAVGSWLGSQFHYRFVMSILKVRCKNVKL
jgi:hypothetical protein